MPKHKRDDSLSSDTNLSSFSCKATSSKQLKNPLEDEENTQDWEDARCPVCLEHPHNGILLICSSYRNGCRPFMCNTSARHSNCFDQYCISFTDPSIELQIPDDIETSISTMPPATATSETDNSVSDLGTELVTEAPITVIDINPVKCKVVCPLCRGKIRGWTIVENARELMNEKVRCCSAETCDYSGDYKDLREHAKSVHPHVHPTDADPERQRNWRRLERRRDVADLFSSIHTSVADDGSFVDLFGGMTPSERTDANGAMVSVHVILLLIRPNASRARNNENDANDVDTSTERGRRRFRRIRRRLNPEIAESAIPPVNPDRDNEETESDSS